MMIEKKVDARIIKTKRDLRATLLHLMETEPFDKINVSEICNEAMINRMTFYKHYDDKYDLLNDLLLDLKNKILLRHNKNYPDITLNDEPVHFILSLIETIADICLEEKIIFKLLTSSELVLTMVYSTIEKSINELLNEINKNYHFKYDLESIAVTIAGGASFLMSHWLSHQPEKTKDEFLSHVKSFLNDLIASKILFID